MENKTIQIQVLGSGCSTCKKLFELTKQATEGLDQKIAVKYITDIQKIVEMGVMSSPVLAINGKPVISGSLPDVEKIKETIKNFIANNNTFHKPEAERNDKCSHENNCQL